MKKTKNTTYDILLIGVDFKPDRKYIDDNAATKANTKLMREIKIKSFSALIIVLIALV